MKDEEIKSIFSQNLKNARKENNMTQEMLAEKCNITTQFIRNIEAKEKLGSINTLINICLSLNITPNKLFYEIFQNNIKEDEDLINKINMLSNHDKDIIITLINKMLKD